MAKKKSGAHKSWASRKAEREKVAIRADLTRARSMAYATAAIPMLAGAWLLIATIDLRPISPNENYSAFTFRIRVFGSTLVAFGIALAAAAKARARRIAPGIASWRAFCKDVWHSLSAPFTDSSRLHAICFAALLFTAIIFRLRVLFLPLRYDEAFTTAEYAAWASIIGISRYTAANNHLFHTLLVHLSMSAFGLTDWAIRMPAFVAGVLIAPTTYAFGRVYYDKWTGLAAMAAVTVMPVLIEYSVNARGYSVITLLFIVGLLAAEKIRTSEDVSKPAWWVLVASGSLGIFTVPVMVYFLLATGAWLAVSALLGDVAASRSLVLRRLAGAIAASVAGAALLWLPALIASGPGAVIGNSEIRPLPTATFFNGLGHHLDSTANLWNRGVAAPVGIMLAALSLLGILANRRLSAARVPVFPVVVVVSLVGITVQRVHPYPRVWLPLVPVYLATAAAGAGFLIRLSSSRKAIPALAGTLLAACLVAVIGIPALTWRTVETSTDTGTAPDARTAVESMIGEFDLRKGDWIAATTPADSPIQIYLAMNEADPAFLDATPSTRRVFVYVNKENQTLDSVLERRGAYRREGTEARLIRDFPTAELWELTFEEPGSREEDAARGDDP